MLLAQPLNNNTNSNAVYRPNANAAAGKNNAVCCRSTKSMR